MRPKGEPVRRTFGEIQAAAQGMRPKLAAQISGAAKVKLKAPLRDQLRAHVAAHKGKISGAISGALKQI
jgi:hypothetical protein